MITKVLSQKLVLLVIGLAAGSGILIPAGYASFHPVTSSEIQDGTIQSVDIGDGQVQAVDIGFGAVNSAKIADNSITAADIGANAVGASEIATNAVGAAEIAANAVGGPEIAGVGDLFFAECAKTSNTFVAPGAPLIIFCDVEGARSGDVAIATISNSHDTNRTCFAVTNIDVFTDLVHVYTRNTCTTNYPLGTVIIAIVVFDTTGVIIP